MRIISRKLGNRERLTAPMRIMRNGALVAGLTATRGANIYPNKATALAVFLMKVLRIVLEAVY